MSEFQVCPRRVLEFGPWDRTTDPVDKWEVREQFANGIVARHCSHCGSLHPDDLMTGLRDGTFHVGGSDKNYKWYIGRLRNPAEVKADWLAHDPVVATIRLDAVDEAHAHTRIEEEWARMRDTYCISQETKFYTPHLPRAAAKEFLAMWKAKTLSHSMYVTPWFPSLGEDAPAWLTGEDE